MTAILSRARVLAHQPSRLPWPLPVVASAALLTGGYEHLSLYRRGYRFIPTIGVLFALNVAASAAFGILALVRREVVVRLAALAVSVTTLGFFGASRLPGGVFRFQERGLQPSPQAIIALIAEVIATAVLAVSFVWDVRDLDLAPDSG